MEQTTDIRRRSVLGTTNNKRHESIDVFDYLPQPYRMITKLIEMEIIDTAWLEIIRKHPELQVDSNGHQVTLSRNHKLNESFASVKKRELPLKISGIIETNGLMCSVDTNSMFTVLSGDNYEFIISEDLLNRPVPGEAPENQPVPSETVKTSPRSLAAAAAAASDLPAAKPVIVPLSHLLIGPHCSLSKVSERDSGIFSFHSRVVVYGLVQVSEPKVLEPGKKPAAPAKGAPVNPDDNEDKFAMFRVQVVDIVRVVNFAGQPQLSIKQVCDLSADKYPLEASLDLQRILYENISLSLSADGLMLSVVTSGTNGSCKLYSLPGVAAVTESTEATNNANANSSTAINGAAANPAPIVSVPAKSTAATAATTAAVTATSDATGNKPPVVVDTTKLVLLAELSVNCAALSGFKAQHMVIIPPSVPESTEIATYVPPPPTQSRASIKTTAGGGSAKQTTSNSNNTAAPNSGRPNSSRSNTGNTGRQPLSARSPLSARGKTLNGIASGASLPAPVPEPVPPIDYERLTVAVLLKEASKWVIFGLRAVPEKVEPVVETKAKKPAATEVPVPVPPAYLFDLYVLSEWGMTCPVTSCMTDSRHELLALGQEDGEVSLWNLSDRSLVNILGRHRASVSCVYLTAETDCSQYYLVSGATDGTICFYSTLLAEGESESTKLSMTLSVSRQPKSKKRTISAIALKDFRSDMSTSNPVVQFQTSESKVSSVPLLFAQYRDGSILVYDFKNITLVGRLDMTERQGFATVTMPPLMHSTLPPLTVPVRVPLEGEIAAAPVVTTEPAKKGALPVPVPVAPVVVAKPTKTAMVNKILLDRTVSSASTTHFHCVLVRGETPTMFTYHLGNIMKRTAHSIAAAEEKIAQGIAADNAAELDTSTVSTRRSSVGKFGRNAIPTHSHLKLTEERLHALELSFKNLNGDSTQPMKPAEPAIEVKKQEFNPRKSIQQDVLRSKVEREGRKARLVRNMNELSNFF